jgi:hypothetical protein
MEASACGVTQCVLAELLPQAFTAIAVEPRGGCGEGLVVEEVDPGWPRHHRAECAATPGLIRYAEMGKSKYVSGYGSFFSV